MKLTSLAAAALALALAAPLPLWAQDTDADGYPDEVEVANGYSPYAPNARLEHTDRDGDGLNDLLESRFSSNPEATDTDGDGYADGPEVSAGYSPTDPAPAALAKRIEITLATQRLGYHLGNVQLGEFAVSTGRTGYPTPIGEFQVYSKHPRAWSNRAKLWMPWWMAFYPSGLYGIHELPEWPGGKKEGESHLGTPASGGCVRLGVGPAKLLYDWAPIGTKVVIRR